jgi:hypothetical protein
MAILITNDGDKTVNTIADRNAIIKRFDGMQVTVLDSIADILTGGGEAGYQWNETHSRWMLIWKSTPDTLTFVVETKLITDGKVTADYVPYNSLVWDAYITDNSNNVIANITPTASLKDILIGSNTYDGLSLTYTYGYNLIYTAVSTATTELQAFANEASRVGGSIPIIESLIVQNDKIVLTYPPKNGVNGILGPATVKHIDAGVMSEAPVTKDNSDATGKTFIVALDYPGQWDFNSVLIQYLYVPPLA